MPFTEQRTVASPTGATFNVYVRQAEAQPAPSCRSTTDWPSMRRAMPASPISWPRAAISLYAHDHRGHGYTKAPDAPQGSFGETDGGAKVIADIGAVHDSIRREHPALPLIIFGHSMGGIIALNSCCVILRICRRRDLERQFFRRRCSAALAKRSSPGSASASARTFRRACCRG